MARKPIPESTQNAILLKSRRRCCLCFWLNGTDEVQKGQIAHIDQDNENPDEDNLAFLCFDHHDDYDGTTRLAKGLKPEEVRHWRNELYREMEYRFRTFQKRDFELTILGFKYAGPDYEILACFRLKNVGEISCKSPTVTIRLPNEIRGEIPEQTHDFNFGHGMVASMPQFNPFAAREERQDIFEPNGRVCVWELQGMNPVLMAGHSVTFDALYIDLMITHPGSLFSLDYRVDAENMPPILGNVETVLPKDSGDFLPE